jgi:hypothetical protein
MRKLLALLASTIGVLAAGSGNALALHGGPELRAYGTGTAVIGTTIQEFSFSSRFGEHEFTDPLGEPHGRMRLVARFGGTVNEFTAEVTCMTVVGRRATIGGKVTRFTSSTGFVLTNRGLIFDVTDNTAVGGEQLVPDQFQGFTAADPPQVCPPPSGAGGPVVEGDIVVEQN